MRDTQPEWEKYAPGVMRLKVNGGYIYTDSADDWALFVPEPDKCQFHNVYTTKMCELCLNQEAPDVPINANWDFSNYPSDETVKFEINEDKGINILRDKTEFEVLSDRIEQLEDACAHLKSKQFTIPVLNIPREYDDCLNAHKKMHKDHYQNHETAMKNIQLLTQAQDDHAVRIENLERLEERLKELEDWTRKDEEDIKCRIKKLESDNKRITTLENIMNVQYYPNGHVTYSAPIKPTEITNLTTT